tara:strand:- start:385 stop:1059 length:675 start_codon:yes stop_codon:yes gene_type:complete
VSKKKKKFLVITGIKLEEKTLHDRDVTSGYGYGNRNSEIETKRHLNIKPDCIISFGFAGSTTEKLRCGDIIMPKKIVSKSGLINETSEKYRKYFIKKLPKNSFEKILYTSDQIINSITKKEEIFDRFNAFAVDMESASIQKIANEQDISFVCIRVILDDKLLCFPEEIENIFNKQSKISKIEIVKLLIKKPGLFFILFKISFYFFRSLMALRKVSTKIFKIKSF